VHLFDNLEEITYTGYIKKFPFHLGLDIKIEDYYKNISEQTSLGNVGVGDLLQKKLPKDIWSSVNPVNKIPFPAELDDLIRLHYLVVSRKVTTILEFGVGKSTFVFDHALEHNKTKFASYVKDNLRRSNLMECHSLNNSKRWIKSCKENYKTKNVTYHFSKCRMGTFEGQACTFYDKIPNISPDLIYLDAPDQFSPTGSIGGISTRHPDRMPMSGDILRFENFLLPGTLIVVDGRAANARFIKNNLKRNWRYQYEEKYDQHFFELIEEPLGRYNRKQLEFIQNSSLD
jgi:hypothetical protein